MNSSRHGFTLLEVLIALAILTIIIGALSRVHTALARAHDRGRAIDASRVAASRIANRSWAGYPADEAAAGCPVSWHMEHGPSLSGTPTNLLILDRWEFAPSNHSSFKTELYLRKTGK